MHLKCFDRAAYWEKGGDQKEIEWSSEERHFELSNRNKGKKRKMLDCGVSRNTQIGLGGKVKFAKPTADRWVKANIERNKKKMMSMTSEMMMMMQQRNPVKIFSIYKLQLRFRLIMSSLGSV